MRAFSASATMTKATRPSASDTRSPTFDEVAQSGYEWIELGPYGYLPTDPAVLTEETSRRGLKVSAGTVFTGLHHGDAVWEKTWAHVADNAVLAQAMGASHLVVIPSFWRDDKTGEVLEPDTLTPEQWRNLTSLTERPGKEVRERYGLQIVVHPHADTLHSLSSG